jgi:hypothetical protein
MKLAPSLRLAPLTEEAVARVAFAMRAADAAEIFAVRFAPDRLRLAREICLASRLGVVGEAADGTPVAVLCAVELAPGLFSLGFFATDRWPEIARPFTRWARGAFKRLLLDAGGRRAEVWSAEDYAWAHRWLRHFGFRAETAPCARGLGGKRYVLFGWEVDRDGA